MDPEMVHIKEQLDLIMSHTQSDMDPEQSVAFAKAAWEIQDKYETALKTSQDKDASAAAQKYAKEVTDSINKNLPNLTKGVLAATTAFKSGDYMNGSAAIMDICAAGAQMIGSLSAAAGPYGAVFGAIFSIVGQLLTYFGPKQPSLKDQIIDAIRGLEAEKRLQQAKADGEVVQEYTETIYRVRTSLPRHLEQPFVTKTDIRNFRTDLGADLLSITSAFNKVSALYKKWDTAEWLKDANSQQMEKWPEVLGAFCRTYSDSLLANTALASMANEQLVDKRLDDASSSNPDYSKYQHDFDEINNLLIGLRTIVKALPAVWNDGNNLMRKFLKQIEPIAQDRGLFVGVGNNGFLYAATGQKAIHTGWQYMKAAPDNTDSGYGYIQSLSMALPWGEAAAPNPQYHSFILRSNTSRGPGVFGDGRSDAIEHRTIVSTLPPTNSYSSPKGGFSPQRGGGALRPADVWGDNPVVSAVWASAGDRPQDGPNHVWLFLAIGQQIRRLRFNYKAKEDYDRITDDWVKEAKAPVVSVRVVYPKSLPDDPDGAVPEQSPEVLGGWLYAGLESSDIYVAKHAHDWLPDTPDGYVPAPWNDFKGHIAVDQHYLWAFVPWGMACATHASVIKCLHERAKGNKESAPRWKMIDGPGELLYQGPGSVFSKVQQPPMKGIADLAPCDDGTLTITLFTRRYDAQGQFAGDDGSRKTYTTRYSADVQGRGLNTIHFDGWTELQIGDFQQVLKQPVPCWPLLVKLKADLTPKLK